MPPRRRRSEEELQQEWKDELPMAIWRVHRHDFDAQFTAYKGKVVKADRQIEALLGLGLVPALEVCWDKNCKTTILPPEDKR